MKRGVGWLKEPLFHLVVAVAFLAFWFGPSRGARTAPTRGAGHHNGQCHACAAGLAPELVRERDLYLAKTGCIELADE